MCFNNAKWIWCENQAQADSYGEFYVKLPVHCVLKRTVLNLSADSDYALFINGEYVASNQYSDFEYYKVYDSLDITKYLREGDNDIAILVWYFGVSTQKYKKAEAGVIFEVVQDGAILLSSNENVLSRKSLTYKNGRQKYVSSQLGFSFYYDATKEDDWMVGEALGFKPSILVKKSCGFVPRPNKKLDLLEKVTASSAKKWHSNLVVTVDLGRECVGLPLIEFDSPVEQKVIITWAESLSEDNIRRYISRNDHSFEYMAKKGKNVYFNPFLRLGCRYMAVESEVEMDVTYVGIKPFTYSLEEKAFPSLSEVDNKIYRLCVDTLKLCAFERPVDCPFREQGFYAYDTRNQLLAGYYAFENYELYAKSSIAFMAMDRREDALLSITTPSEGDLVIPAYSLYYIIMVWEYLQNTKIETLPESVIEKIEAIMMLFDARMENGLIPNFVGEETVWNFYDWSAFLDGYYENRLYDGKPDLIINCLYLLSYQAYRKICDRIQRVSVVDLDVESFRVCIYEMFYNREVGLFTMFADTLKFTQLGNSFAILANVVKDEQAAYLCERMLKNEQCVNSTLALKPFYYDALLKVNESYKGLILEEIRQNYQFMMEHGATSAWETMEGDACHGSLCHGWSAIPIYYYNLFFGTDD